MAKAIITFKLMPESQDTNLDAISKKAQDIAQKEGAIWQMKTKIEPIAFVLKADLVMAMYDVEGSDFDAIAEKMSLIDGVQNAEVAKMDLALG